MIFKSFYSTEKNNFIVIVGKYYGVGDTLKEANDNLIDNIPKEVEKKEELFSWYV